MLCPPKNLPPKIIYTQNSWPQRFFGSLQGHQWGQEQTPTRAHECSGQSYLTAHLWIFLTQSVSPPTTQVSLLYIVYLVIGVLRPILIDQTVWQIRETESEDDLEFYPVRNQLHAAYALQELTICAQQSGRTLTTPVLYIHLYHYTTIILVAYNTLSIMSEWCWLYGYNKELKELFINKFHDKILLL